MKQNLLQYYVSLLRTNKDTQVSSEHREQCVTALHNAIRTMCFSRNNKICGEDFSNLDFGNIPLNGIKFSVEGSAPCSFSGSTLHEWNLYSGHRYPVTSANFSGNGKYIITADIEGKVIIWDIKKNMIHKQYLNLIKTHSFYYPMFSLTLRERYKYSPCSAIISQNGNFFAISYREFIRFSNGKLIHETIKICETTTGKHYRVLEEYHHNFSLSSMEFTHDECYLITCTNDNKAKMWNTSNGKFVRDFVGHAFIVTSVGFSEDDTLCITGSKDHTAMVWDTKTGKCIKTLKEKGHIEPITSVAISDDKHYYLTGAKDGTAKLWTSNGECKYTFDTNSGMITKVRFDSNFKQCITISRDGTIEVWSLETGELICTRWWMEDTMQFINSSDIFDRNYIHLYDNGFMIKSLECDSMSSDFKYHYCSASIGISISCNYFLTGVSNDHVILFDKNQKKKICDFDFSISDKYGIPESVNISSDEHFFMIGFGSSNMIIIYNMDTKETKEIVNTFDKYTDIIKVSFLPKHDSIFVLTDDGIGRYLDIETGKYVPHSSIRLFVGDILSEFNTEGSIDFSQDWRYCFCKYSDGIFKLWEFGNKKPIHVFELEDVDHSFVSVSSKYCAIITNDLRIWDIQTEEFLCNRNARGVSWDKVKMFNFLVDGDYFVIGNDDSHDYDFNQETHITVDMFETKTGKFIKYLAESHLGGIIWQFPYYIRFRDNYMDIYELDCFSSENEILSNYIGRFYLVDDLNVKGCDFSNIDADEVIKDILSQYNGNL